MSAIVIWTVHRCRSKVSGHCKVYQVHKDSRSIRHMEHQNGCLLLILGEHVVNVLITVTLNDQRDKFSIRFYTNFV